MFRSRRLMRRFYRSQGVPEELAHLEAEAVTPEMRRCISKIYRSQDSDLAKIWEQQLDQLPKHGLLIFGDRDPYVPLSAAVTFAERRGALLHIEEGAGHWAFAERPNVVAAVLNSFWDDLP